jgi:hypothetical protein
MVSVGCTWGLGIQELQINGGSPLFGPMQAYCRTRQGHRGVADERGHGWLRGPGQVKPQCVPKDLRDAQRAAVDMRVRDPPLIHRPALLGVRRAAGSGADAGRRRALEPPRRVGAPPKRRAFAPDDLRPRVRPRKHRRGCGTKRDLDEPAEVLRPAPSNRSLLSPGSRPHPSWSRCFRTSSTGGASQSSPTSTCASFGSERLGRLHGRHG